MRLNRRLAPDIYLNVTPITRVRGGYRVGGTGRVVEYAVKMKRIPDKVILERMIKEETITAEIIKRVAEKIAAFHKDALTNKGISGFGENRNNKAKYRGEFFSGLSFYRNYDKQ